VTSENPYSSPAADAFDVSASAADSETLGAIARATFLAWEKLRLLYVAILGSLTLLLAVLESTELLWSFRFWATVVQGAVAANICYFAGPVAETFVTWLGLRARWPRVVLFSFGTILSCLLALGVLAGLLLPDMD
jgi:hypothetical protein